MSKRRAVDNISENSVLRNRLREYLRNGKTMLDLTKFRRYISWLRDDYNGPDYGEGGFAMKRLIPFVIVFAFLFSSCTTTPNSSELTSSAIPTSSVTPVPSPSLTSTPDPTTTATATESPTATQESNLSADEMSVVMSSAEKNLANGFKFIENLDNTYSISGPDGTPVKNIVLKGDGKFYVTEADGTEIAIDPLTVHMPSPDKIYAELQQVDVATGDVEAIPIEDTLWKTDKDVPSVVEDTIESGRYQDWVDNSKFGAQAKAYLASLNPTNIVKWEIRNHGLGPFPAGASPVELQGINAIFSGTGLLPTGYKSYPDSPMPLDQLPSSKDIASIFNASFVKLVGPSPAGTNYENVSITPLFVKPNESQDAALFPLLVDSNQITAPLNSFYSLRLNLALQHTEDGVPIKSALAPISKLDSKSTIDGLSGTETLQYIGAGKDTTAEAKRTAILNSKDLDGSGKQVWGAAYYTVLEK